MRQLGVKEWLHKSISGSMQGCLDLPTLNARELATAMPHPGITLHSGNIQTCAQISSRSELSFCNCHADLLWEPAAAVPNSMVCMYCHEYR